MREKLELELEEAAIEVSNFEIDEALVKNTEFFETANGSKSAIAQSERYSERFKENVQVTTIESTQICWSASIQKDLCNPNVFYLHICNT